MCSAFSSVAALLASLSTVFSTDLAQFRDCATSVQGYAEVAPEHGKVEAIDLLLPAARGGVADVRISFRNGPVEYVMVTFRCAGRAECLRQTETATSGLGQPAITWKGCANAWLRDGKLVTAWGPSGMEVFARAGARPRYVPNSMIDRRPECQSFRGRADDLLKLIQ